MKKIRAIFTKIMSFFSIFEEWHGRPPHLLSHASYTFYILVAMILKQRPIFFSAAQIIIAQRKQLVVPPESFL